METKKLQDKPLSNTEVSSFCGQIALILKSGISSLEGITIMLEDTDTPQEQAILKAILENLEETGSLCQALDSTGLFPAYMVHMVEIGEETGSLDQVMDSMRNHYEREDMIAKSIRNAVTYPLIMAGMMVAVIVVLLVKVMPIFNQVFIQLGTEMTGFSRGLMNLGTIINRYAILFIIIIAVIVFCILVGTKTAVGREIAHKLAYKFAPTRKMREEIAACRFSSGMALTLRSGLNPERGLELTDMLTEDPYFKERLTECKKEVDDGMDLSEALHKTGIFTGLYARMASIGTKTGSMDQVMEQIAELYQDHIDNRINNRLAVLEPTLVIVLSLIVGVILLSVMLPLMGIMSSL